MIAYLQEHLAHLITYDLHRPNSQGQEEAGAIVLRHVPVHVQMHVACKHDNMCEGLHFVPQSPKDGSKDKSNSQGQEEARAIVLRHAPVHA